MTGAVTRPALRYHGGKWHLAPWVIGHFPPHRIYTEAFGGAASVLLQKTRSCGEVYNDLDDDVVNVFRVLRDPGQASELERLLRLTPFARTEWDLAYQPSADPVEQARRTICRSQMGFGSDSCGISRATGFRSNVTRRGTTPAMDWARWPDHVRSFVERLAGVTIECRDAIEVLSGHDTPQALHYVDPPYVGTTRSDSTRGYRHNLDDDGHRKLSEVLRGLAGYVVLSGYRCLLYDELYRDWERVDRPVIVFRATPRTESLWLSPRASRALESGLFDRIGGDR